MAFDIPRIVASNLQQLEPEERKALPGAHYTTLTLHDLQVRLRGRTLAKVKDHLRSIYRIFLRDGLLELRLNGEELSYEPPLFLRAPYYATPNGKPEEWRKEIDLDLGGGHRVRGWAAILARASVTNAGFAIFRRRRLIQGSHGEGYRPEQIFGKSNKFVYQRLVGELEVDGFSVSHTKDGVQWEDWEEDILAWLKSELDSDPKPLLDQAENYRARESTNRDLAGEAAWDTSFAIAQHLPPIIDEQLEAKPDEAPLAPRLEPVAEELHSRSNQVDLELTHSHRRWSVSIELVSDASRESWYELSEAAPAADATQVQIRLNLEHPFMIRFVSPAGDELVPFTRLVAGLAIAEITAREVGVRQAGTLRRNLSQILRSALSGPLQRAEASHGS